MVPWSTGRSGCALQQSTTNGSSGPQPFAQIRTDRGSGDNPLWVFFDSIADAPLVDKWDSYFDVYHRSGGFLREPTCLSPALHVSACLLAVFRTGYPVPTTQLSRTWLAMKLPKDPDLSASSSWGCHTARCRLKCNGQTT